MENGILPKELSNKLLNYHQQSYIYNAPVFQFDKTSEKGIIVSWQKMLLSCGVVALLLGYSIKRPIRYILQRTALDDLLPSQKLLKNYVEF